MRRVLIVEDTPADVRQSTAVVKKLGAEDVIALNNIAAAILFLQDVVEGTKPAPDLILLDLSFPEKADSKYCGTGSPMQSSTRSMWLCGP